MTLNIKKLLEASKSNIKPKSSEIDSEDNRFLPPASYDRKLVDATFGDSKVSTHGKEDDENFKTQDKVKKHTGAPLRESGVEEIQPSSNSLVNRAYADESFDLLEELVELMEEGDEDAYFWKHVAENLKCARDCLLNSIVSESAVELDENFSVGKIKLHDGSSITVSKDDARILNYALVNTKDKDSFLNEVTKNKKEFNNFLKFARNLNEDYSKTLDDLLENLDENELYFLEDSDLSEAELWKRIKSGARQGAETGAKVGAAGGAAVGGTVGAAAGGAYGAVTGSNYGAAGAVSKGVRDGAKAGAIGAAGGAAVGAGAGAAVGGLVGAAKAAIKKKKINEQNSLEEGDIWNATKAGTKAGAKIGGKIGQAVGTVGGGLYGGAAAGTVAAAKKANKIRKLITDIKSKQNHKLDEDCNNEKKSILGTSAPAMDSDPNTDKKKNIQEINSLNIKPARKGTVKWYIEQQKKSDKEEGKYDIKDDMVGTARIVKDKDKLSDASYKKM